MDYLLSCLSKKKKIIYIYIILLLFFKKKTGTSYEMTSAIHFLFQKKQSPYHSDKIIKFLRENHFLISKSNAHWGLTWGSYGLPR
jgi:hypothetical protein